MKTKKNWALTLLSIIAICISLAALIICIRHSCMQHQQTSDLVAALSVLVAALIGFQIFNIIDLEKRLDRFKNEEKSHMKSATTTAIGVALSELGTAECLLENHQVATKLLLNSLLYIYDGDSSDNDITSIAHMAAENLNLIITDAEKNNIPILFPVKDEIRAKYILAVSKYAPEIYRQHINA